MITGDYHHTAIAVARAVGIIKEGGQVMIIDTVKQDSEAATPAEQTFDSQVSTTESNFASQVSMTENNILLAHASNLAQLFAANEVRLPLGTKLVLS